jgi:RNase H-like domain found in reverse transcriptase
MKVLMAKETLVTFPAFTKEFEFHTDASKLQLGACISQEGKPVAFYSCKLQPAQTHYTTT